MKPIDFLYNPNGRVSRKQIWVGFLLPYLAITLALQIWEGAWPGPAVRLIQSFFGLFYFWPTYAVSIKRFHDIGRSGWWAISFVTAIIVGMGYGALRMIQSFGVDRLSGGYQPTPEELAKIINETPVLMGIGASLMMLMILFVLLYIFAGQKGHNRFGDDPLDR